MPRDRVEGGKDRFRKNANNLFIEAIVFERHGHFCTNRYLPIPEPRRVQPDRAALASIVFRVDYPVVHTILEEYVESFSGILGHQFKEIHSFHRRWAKQHREANSVVNYGDDER